MCAPLPWGCWWIPTCRRSPADRSRRRRSPSPAAAPGRWCRPPIRRLVSDHHVAQLWGGCTKQPVNRRSAPDEHVGQSLHVVVGAERRGGQQDFDVAVEQLLAHFAGGDEGGERDHHGADSRRREHCDDELRAVGVEQPHVGALAGAKGDQPTGKLRRPAVGLGVADAVCVADEKRVVPARAGLMPQDLGDRGDHRAWSLSTADSFEEASDLAQVGFARRGTRDRADDRDLGGNLVASQSCSQVLHQRRRYRWRRTRAVPPRRPASHRGVRRFARPQPRPPPRGGPPARHVHRRASP